MKFGPLNVVDAVGAILAHSVEVEGRRLRKAHVLTAEDVASLLRQGKNDVIAAVIEPGDVGENEAAQAIADAIVMRGVQMRPPATGRVNLHAEAAGVLAVDVALINAINAVDPAITIATLPLHAPVAKGQMVATIKIIPYAVRGNALEQVLAVCQGHEPFHVDAFESAKVGLIQTEQPGLKSSILDKTAKVTQERLDRSGSHIGSEMRVGHDAKPVADALAKLVGSHDLLVVFGASAVSDDSDVIPDAIRQAGGAVLRTGMPVDPGNLLVLGELNGKTVIGAPGCARSPKENGFDWVLDRVLAGHDVSGNDIAGMGVGGLLMEIASRPQPREAPASRPETGVHAVVLAAGQSSRMGGPNKLMADFDGLPLIRRTVLRVADSKAAGITVVAGHQATRLREALNGLRVSVTQNARFADGLSSSLKAGIGSLPDTVSGAMIVLGDMPGITGRDLNRLIDAFDRSERRAIIRATHAGKRGNPVILPRRLFAAVASLEGDTGARHLIEAAGEDVLDVELGEAASMDVDTPEAIARAGGILRG